MKPFVSNNKGTVLFSALDWGLGHASRLIPLIHQYHNGGYNVLIGGSGKSAELLKLTFPEIPFVLIKSIAVSYFFKGNWFVLNIFLQLPVFLHNAIREHLVLKKLITRYSVSMVISDNRYGLYNFNVRSIIITHQISPVLPRFMRFAEYSVYKMMKIFVGHFDECWIPDFSGQNNLSGRLSHRYALPSNVKFIGPLSRFRLKNPNRTAESYDNVIILSGPQPELCRMTRKILDKISCFKETTMIISGFQDISEFNIKNPFVTVVSHLEPGAFRSVIENASLIISTAGYSGIMDLFIIGRPAVLVAVKGQTEQEYLCGYLEQKKLFITVPVDRLDFSNSAVYKEKLRDCRSVIAGIKDQELLNQECNEHY